MIRFSNVTKLYPGQGEALKSLDLYIPPEQMVFVTGHSGAGKSTLLRLIALMENHTRGEILIDNINIQKIAEKHRYFLRRQIGFIFQDHRLLNDRSIFDNVALPLVISGFDYKEIPHRVHAALDKVGLLSKEKKLPQMLSSGEQQRVGIARAVVNRPPILLADEPTGNLDPALSIEIMRLFEEFNNIGVTVVIATHEIQMAMRLGHRMIALRDGQQVMLDADDGSHSQEKDQST
ncbi:MAG: cell division ATP-binding protein FtsE [Gammaproteobacteria bacterium]